MLGDLQIRESEARDRPAMDALYGDAFPDENLLPLLNDLLREPTGVLSLVGVRGATVVGHVMFTACGIEGSDARAALLGPLGVATAVQRQGVGSALVRDGLRRLQGDGIACVCVLGDPNYYARFGFEPEAGVLPPYELPAEWQGVWRSLRLGLEARVPRGKLVPPAPWMQPELWAA